MFGLIAAGAAAWSTDEVASITGTAPRSLPTFIAEHVNAFRQRGGSIGN